MNTKELFEKRLEKVVKSIQSGCFDEAPFPFTGDEARCYLLGEQETLRWVLEMME